MKTPSIKTLDKLWADCIKARAGMQSEYRKAEGYLHAHHILGKSSYRLRWDLNNGICLTGGQHKFIAHGSRERASEFEMWALEKRGVRKEDLMILKNTCGGVDKFGVYVYLKQKLYEYTDLKSKNG